MEKIKIKINIVVIIILLVISSLFYTGKVGFDILSGIRAYVGGEGLWAKNQKDGVYHLVQYVQTQEKIRYELFLKSLKIPLGDKIARQELDKNNFNYEIVFQGFLDGGNHPDDIPTMIFLYKRFKNLEYINQAIYQWELGDNYIQDLLSVGEEIHNLIKANKMNSEKTVQIFTRIDELQKKLTDAENQFSYNMSMAARWASNLVFIVMLIFSIAGGLICIILIRFISGIISDLNDKKTQIEKQAEELEAALVKVKKLSGLLPICSYCKKIRDDKGYWTQIESYIHAHSDADFSHSICNDCANKHYPDMNIYDDTK